MFSMVVLVPVAAVLGLWWQPSSIHPVLLYCLYLQQPRGASYQNAPELEYGEFVT